MVGRMMMLVRRWFVMYGCAAAPCGDDYEE